MSAGTMSAPSTSPDFTSSSASSRLRTRTGSIDLNSSPAYLDASSRWLPS
jgi:hypothetical protein